MVAGAAPWSTSTETLPGELGEAVTGHLRPQHDRSPAPADLERGPVAGPPSAAKVSPSSSCSMEW